MRIRNLHRIAFTFICCIGLSGLSTSTLAQRGNDGANGAAPAADRTLQETRIKGGITTLYALDPLARTLCFTDGKDGHVFQDGQARNRCSHLDFDSYQKGAFTAGIQGGQAGIIIDLGTASDLQQGYGYEETVGRPNGFASIQIKDHKPMILRDRKTNTLQELREGGILFQAASERDSSAKATATIMAGHIYLARIIDRNDPSFQLLVKMLVLSYVPNQSVTFRWELL
jgi:hypothetical protein